MIFSPFQQNRRYLSISDHDHRQEGARTSPVGRRELLRVIGFIIAITMNVVSCWKQILAVMEFPHFDLSPLVVVGRLI